MSRVRASTKTLAGSLREVVLHVRSPGVRRGGGEGPRPLRAWLWGLSDGLSAAPASAATCDSCAIRSSRAALRHRAATPPAPHVGGTGPAPPSRRDWIASRRRAGWPVTIGDKRQARCLKHLPGAFARRKMRPGRVAHTFWARACRTDGYCVSTPRDRTAIGSHPGASAAPPPTHPRSGYGASWVGAGTR